MLQISLKRSVSTWLLAARPKTLWAAAAPVLVGTAMAIEVGALHWPAATAALLGAILIQIGTNFSNDYLDYLRGADSEDRKGPLRVTQAGMISPATMQKATVAVFVLAFLVGLYLVYRGGWPILLLGLISIGAGVMYTAGRYSLAYLGLGDLAVLIFFGPVAVGGTYYVQALAISPLVLVAGLGPGLLATAILIVNNVRDVEEDRLAEKRTLVVRFGRLFGIRLYLGCVVLAALIPLGMVFLTGHRWGLALAALILPLGWRYASKMKHAKDPNLLNQLLGETSQLLMVYAVLLSIGWNI